MKKINLLPVKKSLMTAAAGATMLAFSVTPSLASNFQIEFFSDDPKIVDLNLDSIDKTTGDFSGVAINNEQPNEVWEVVGTQAGQKVEIELSGAKGSQRIVASGTIQDDGVIAGRAATEDGELFEWEATDALVNTKAS